MDRLIIRIHRKDEQSGVYPITAYSGTQDSKGITNAAGFRNPLKSRELDGLQGYVEKWKRTPEEERPAAVTMTSSLAGWGEELFRAIFNGSLRGIYESYCNEHNAPPPLHLWIEAPELWELPWELLRDADQNWSLALAAPITRTVERPAAEAEELSEDFPLKVLYVVARPDDAGFLGLAEPLAVLKELRDPENPALRNAVQIDLLRPPTYDRFLEQIQRGYHIVHFDGHGWWNSGTQQGGLCFENPPDQQGKRNTNTVTAGMFQNALMGSGVKLLIMSACKSGQPHQSDAYSSVAHVALKAGVSAVVVMRYNVFVDTACVFHKYFYHELMSGKSVEEATLQARRHVEGMADHPLQDWFVPVIYQQASSVRFFGDAPAQAQPRPVPCTVPELDMTFVGRERELLDVDRALTLENVSAVTVSGIGGVGKTSLALALVDWYKAGNAFPGGYFWHSFETGGTADAVVDEIGAALMGGERWAQESPDEKPEIVLRHLSENSSLLVWDNFETVTQNADAEIQKGLREFLRKLPGRSRALVTSRRMRVGVTPRSKEKAVSLNVLSRSDAEKLTWLYAQLEDVSGKLSGEEDRLPEFLEAVGYHPLGIGLAIPQLAIRDWTLTELTRRLRESVDTLVLDEETYGEELERLREVGASFQLTYDALSEDVQVILPKLAATFPGGMNDGTVQRILEIDKARWDEVVEELNTHNLLTRRPVVLEHLSGLALVWHLHPLLRTFAAARLENPDEWRRSAAEKFTNIAGAQFLQFTRPNAPQALAVFDVEEANLLYWLAYCEAGEHWDWGTNLIGTLTVYYNIRGRWGERERLLQRGISLGERQRRDGAVEAQQEGMERVLMFTADLGSLYIQWGRLDEAETCYQQALEFNQQRSDRVLEAVDWHMLGMIARLRKDYPLAEERYEKALAIRDELGDEEAKADTVVELATAAAQQGDESGLRGDADEAQRHYAEAQRMYQEALEVFSRAGNRERQAIVLGNLGNVALSIGGMTAAERYVQESLKLHKALGNRHGMAMNYGQLSNIYDGLERDQDALSCCIRAAAIFRKLGARERQENLHNAAVLLRRVGRERFAELCQAAAADPTVGHAEVEAFSEELSIFLKRPPDYEFRAKLARAVSYIDSEQYTDATKLLRGFLPGARDQKLHELFAEGLLWLARAYHLNGEHRIAKPYYKDAIAHLRSHNRQDLIAKAQLYLGQLELQIGLVSDALPHLRVARSYFESSNEQDYVDWIDRLYDASRSIEKRRVVWERLQMPLEMEQTSKKGD